MTSSNCYSHLYPFPIDLNEDVYSQPQFHYLEEEKIYFPQDAQLKSDCELKLSMWKQEAEEERVETPQIHENISSAKWMPSKMMNSDHIHLSSNSTQKSKNQHKRQQTSSSPDHSGNSSYNNNSSSTIRVCADCSTTKTPLWRSGPRGPKSLCNACGIRQRKARRAMATSDAAANGTVVTAETTTTPSMKNKVLHFKNKKSRLNFQSQRGKKLCFEDVRTT